MAFEGNSARFTIDGLPSEDANGNRGVVALNSATITLQLETIPSAALSATFQLFDATDPNAPLASLNAPTIIFAGSGTTTQFLNDPDNQTAIFDMPATGIEAYIIRCTTSNPGGPQVFERLIATRGAVSGLRKTVPAESQEFEARGWSDEINRMVDAIESGGGGGGTDVDAVHVNVAGELVLIDEKVTPIVTDVLIIEDVADSNNKKRIQIGNLPGAGATSLQGAYNAGQAVTMLAATGNVTWNASDAVAWVIQKSASDVIAMDTSGAVDLTPTSGQDLSIFTQGGGDAIINAYTFPDILADSFIMPDTQGSSPNSVLTDVIGDGTLSFEVPDHGDLTGVGIDDHHARDHAASHSDAGADEITVENLATGSVDTSTALRPDGAGGLTFVDVAHSELTGVGIDDHHARDHATAHSVGGSDPLATGTPGTIGVGDAAAGGTGPGYALSDHQHALTAPGAPVNVTKAAASAGSASTVARSDHKHDVTTAAPGTGIGGSNSEGSATSLARSDHDHALRTTEGGGTDLTIGSIADGEIVVRSGTTLIGSSGGASSLQGAYDTGQTVAMLAATGDVEWNATDAVSWAIQKSAADVIKMSTAGAVAITPPTNQAHTVTATGTGQIILTSSSSVNINGLGAATISIVADTGSVSIGADGIGGDVFINTGAGTLDISTFAGGDITVVAGVSGGNITVNASAGELTLDDVGSWAGTLSQTGDRTLDLTAGGELYENVTSILGALNAAGAAIGAGTTPTLQIAYDNGQTIALAAATGAMVINATDGVAFQVQKGAADVVAMSTLGALALTPTAGQSLTVTTASGGAAVINTYSFPDLLVDTFSMPDVNGAAGSVLTDVAGDGVLSFVLGVTPAAHASTHSDGASDEITVENLATGSVDTSTALRPDGAGGLTFADVAHSDLTGIGINDHHARDHAAAHSDGGADEITVENLATGSASVNDVLKPDGTGGLTMGSLPVAALPTHASTHENGGSDEISVIGLNGLLADAQTPLTHAASHSDGGADEITVENLATGSVDTSTALRPDGAGGLAFVDVAHSELTGVGIDDHHARDHAAAHSDGGADEIEVEDLATTSVDASNVLKADGAGGLTMADLAHSDLTGLTTGDPHTQYALLAGRSTGQTLKGGTASGEDLILESTDNATKGDVRIATGSTLDANDEDIIKGRTITFGTAPGADTSTSNVLNIDFTENQKRVHVMTENVTSVTFTAPIGTGNFIIRIEQAAGLYSLPAAVASWPAAAEFIADVAPVAPTADGNSILLGIYYDGTTFYVQTSGVFNN